MPDNYSSGRNSYRDYDEQPRRTQSSRSGAPRSAQSSRAPQGARRPAPGSRSSQGTRRPAQTSRPPQGPRRPAPHRRSVQPRFIALVGIVVVIAIVLIVILVNSKGGKTVTPTPTPTPTAQTAAIGNATIESADPGNGNELLATQDVNTAPTATHSTLADWLGDEDASVAALSEEDRVNVSDLSINTTLPSEWLNVLLLGTDERSLSESARTDTMIICSINTKSGAVKLSSIMRDTAVHFDDLGKNSGTYRINAANYFGGPEYAIKTVNELLNMNIQYYVSVNFYGFQKIASALGGIDIDISEAEMTEINRLAVQQAWAAYNNGVDESDLEAAGENVYLEQYGANTHLNGRQTLAYARIRKIDTDYARSERQRKVLSALMLKMESKSAVEILALIASLSSNVSTNMDLNTVGTIAVSVLQSGLTDVDSFRMPENDTYVQETRNEQSMLYDCDWSKNATDLYSFIYS